MFDTQHTVGLQIKQRTITHILVAQEVSVTVCVLHMTYVVIGM